VLRLPENPFPPKQMEVCKDFNFSKQDGISSTKFDCKINE
jgi:hypothetical protein